MILFLWWILTHILLQEYYETKNQVLGLTPLSLYLCLLITMKKAMFKNIKILKRFWEKESWIIWKRNVWFRWNDNRGPWFVPESPSDHKYKGWPKNYLEELCCWYQKHAVSNEIIIQHNGNFESHKLWAIDK